MSDSATITSSPYVQSKPISPKGERFNMDANNYEEVKFYYVNRTEQMLRNNVDFYSLTEMEWGCCACFKFPETNEFYYSVYVFESKRGNGHFSNWLKNNPEKTILTMADCNLESILKKKNHPYICSYPEHTKWKEYEIISEYYGSHCAERTKVLYINHIEEGLYIMNHFKFSDIAQKAYILHPIFQTDDDIAIAWKRIHKPDDKLSSIDPKIIYLAIEYRNVANRYLSFANPHENPKLSPIQEVNEMLIADKIQNRKDFEIYHLGSHPRSDRLDEYFKQWLSVLNISEEQYTLIASNITSRLTPKEIKQ